MANSECLFWDGDDEEPPAYVETHIDVVMILHMLEQACRNEDPAWCLDHALLCIANGSIGRKRDLLLLDRDDREMILQGLARVKALVPRFIPEVSRQDFAVGLDAAAMQVILWSEYDEEQALRHPDTKFDARDLALVLRHKMYNVCLSQKVRERRDERYAETISELIQPFRQAGVL